MNEEPNFIDLTDYSKIPEKFPFEEGFKSTDEAKAEVNQEGNTVIPLRKEEDSNIQEAA